jgi:SRSO17 transposase
VNVASLKKLGRELDEYLESLTTGMGRPERRAAMCLYMTGLLLDGERKSIEPIAARLVDRPGEVQAMRQRLQQAVVVADWAESEIFARIAAKLERSLPGLEAFVIDDTGFEKKGIHSVGVQRQYSGTCGRTENCQVATSLHLAGESGSGCIGMRLYLPDAWTNDQERRKKAGIPDSVEFEEKWRLAIHLLDEALAAGVRKHVVLADAGYGDVSEFRREVVARGLHYVMAVSGKLVIWMPGAAPERMAVRGGKNVAFVDPKLPPVAISEFVPALTYRKVTWRDGSRGTQSSSFAVARVRTASAHSKGHPPGEEQWLLAWWPEGEPRPTKFWLSDLPANTSMKRLVQLAKLRWRVERDYQEMKGELGLDHFEGRTWRGFHHHAALCAAAHAFLALRRALFPPEQNALDALSRSEAPPRGPAAPASLLPDVCSSDNGRPAAAWSLADVIE